MQGEVHMGKSRGRNYAEFRRRERGRGRNVNIDTVFCRII
jgi:hypothetical protein